MPWDLWHTTPGIGGLLQEARESRGLTEIAAATLLATGNYDRYVVRQELKNDSNPPVVRRLAVVLTDQAIVDHAETLTGLRLRQLELAGDAVDPLTIALCAAIYHYPYSFFTRPNPAAPPIVVHLSGSDMPGCHTCGFVADYRCDFPMGDGKTCDADLCERHAVRQGGLGDDLHFCRAHALIAQGMVILPEKEG